MSNKVILDDGMRKYDIENRFGKKICSFYLNPSDTGIVERYNEVVKNLNNMSEVLKENMKEKSNEEIALEAENYIKTQYDYLFNTDISNTFFSVMGATSVLPNGKLFSQHVMEVIGELVKKETGKRLDKLNMRINKYTSKYHG